MKLPELAVSRPVTTAMVYIALVVLGWVSLTRLSIDMLPEIDFPSITVFTSYEGVGPEEMETLITRPIEQAVSTVQGLDRVESFSAEGRARVALRFAWGTPLDGALNDVRAAIERLRDSLPEEAETPIVFKFDLSSFPIMYLTLAGDMDSWRLRELAEDVIKYRLERIEGVAAADIRGGQQREIQIDLDGGRLSAFGITPAQITEALRRENVNLPAGDVQERDREVIVRTVGEFHSLEQMGSVVVAVRQGRPIRVRDLGRVRDAVEEPQNIVFVGGRPGIRIAISKLSGANTVEVAERVRAEVAAINREMPHLDLRARFDTSEYIRDSISNVEQGLLYGAGLALLVLMLFLRSFRATAIVATAIPIAVIGTFALMYVGGFTLNMITFGGLALGLGMLVDSAIVILENIERHRVAGASRIEAAIKGSSEVSTAIVASTVTTLCIFLPVIFVEGFAGIFFQQMAFVVSFALICSLAVALTLVPVMASLGKAAAPSTPVPSSGIARVLGGWLDALEEGYANLLVRVVRWPKTVFACALLIFIASVFLTRFVGVELMPEGDEGEVRISAEMPVSTPLERTAKVMRRVDEIVAEHVPEQEISMWVAGPPGFWSSAGGNAATMRIGLVDLDQRQRSSDEVATALRPHLSTIPGLEARAYATQGFWLFRLLRGGGDRLSVDVLGYDLVQGSKLAERVAELMRTVPGVVNVDLDRKEGAREAAIVIDADRAADLGLSVGEVGDAVSTYVLGKAATYYREGGDEFRVLVQLREEDRRRVDQLESLPLITRDGDRVALGDVATISRKQAPIAIRRLNQRRIITVSGGLEGRDLGSVVSDLSEHLDELRREPGAVPLDFSLTFGGEYEEQQKTFSQLVVGLVLAVLLVYMVMASLFESFLHPLVMLLSVPFAAIGVVLTLLLTGTTFNVYSFLGSIVLVGVVVNNAIVLVDYINLLRRQGGLEVVEAVVQAGRRRLRPILMTTLTTSLALIPVALGLSEGGEMQAPLARVVVGGLLTSTLITLVLVPTLYTVLESYRERRRQRSQAS